MIRPMFLIAAASIGGAMMLTPPSTVHKIHTRYMDPIEVDGRAFEARAAASIPFSPESQAEPPRVIGYEADMPAGPPQPLVVPHDEDSKAEMKPAYPRHVAALR